MSSYVGSWTASSIASSSMFWLNSAIQAVPSACSRWPPVGSGALRSNTPMLSRPRKPPSKTFLPKRSLRFTHQVKFSRSLLNASLRKSTSTVPCRAFSVRCRNSVAKAWTGGLTATTACRSVLAYDSRFLEYDFGSGHPWRPRRLTALLDLLTTLDLWREGGPDHLHPT